MTPAASVIDCPELHPSGPAYDYLLYGFRLRTGMKLTLDDVPAEGAPDIDLLAADPDWFESKISSVELDSLDWIHIHEIPGDWSYVRYDGHFDFLISPSGGQVFYRMLAELPVESFQTYALGRILSFALVKKGCEPLHAATVVVNQQAVAFMGASGFGKSSLATCFVAAGYPLLTDDVLRLEERAGHYMAFPGPPRLKLLPRVARMFAGDFSRGAPINRRNQHPKRVFSLTARQTCATPVPLAAIYVVTAPRNVHRGRGVALSPLRGIEALVKLLSYTHNHEVTSRDRLARQLDAAQRVIQKVPMRALSYPRVLSSLPEVKAAVLADLIDHADIV